MAQSLTIVSRTVRTETQVHLRYGLLTARRTHTVRVEDDVPVLDRVVWEVQHGTRWTLPNRTLREAMEATYQTSRRS